MKKAGLKIVAFFLFALILMNFCYSEETITDKDMNDLQESVEQIPITEEGEIDQTKLKDYKSKLEANIEKINSWLDKNAGWLKIVFGMKPAISWLFIINFLIMIIFLNVLVFNGENIFFFISSKNLSSLFGLVIFALLVVTKFVFLLASLIYGITKIWWILLLIVIVLIAFSPVIDLVIKSFKEQRKKDEEEKEKTNREALDKLVKGATGQ